MGNNPDAYVIIQPKFDNEKLAKDLKKSKLTLEDFEKELNDLLDKKINIGVDKKKLQDNEKIINRFKTSIEKEKRYQMTPEREARIVGYEERLKDLQSYNDKLKESVNSEEQVNYYIEEIINNMAILKASSSDTMKNITNLAQSGNLKGALQETNKAISKTEQQIKSLNNQKIKIEEDQSNSAELEKIKTRMVDLSKQLNDLEVAGRTDSAAYQIKQKMLAEQTEEYKKQVSKVEEINIKVKEQIALQEQLKGKQQEITSQINQQNNAMKGQKELNKTVKKVGKIGLAIFGIRSAYSGIRQIMSSVLGQNEKLGKQMEGIKSSFATAFTPIIQKIINLILKLMGYANAIWQKLFGHDLFKATAKSAEKTAGAAKEINKQLAGFDEANVLTANTSSGAGSSSSDSGLKIPDIKLPDWLEKILDFVKKHPKIAAAIFGVSAFTLFGLAKIGKSLTATALSKILGKAGSAATGTGGVGLLGIVTALAWIAGLTILAVEIVVLWNVGKDIVKNFKALKEEQEAANENAQFTIEKNDEVRDSYKKVKDEVGLTSDQQSIYIGWLKNTMTENKKLMESDGLTKETKKKLGKEIQNCAEAYQELYENGDLSYEQQYDYYKFLANYYSDTIGDINNKMWIFSDTLNGLNKEFRTRYLLEIKETGIKSVKDLLEGFATTLSNLFGNKQLNDFFKKVDQNLGISTGFEKAKSAVNSIVKKIYKADGGIVSMPGRGVPVAYAGEAGREGIIPMDNQQQMEVLGQAIAKYVRIDNYVTNNVDSRKLNTILKQSENKERLANNW